MRALLYAAVVALALSFGALPAAVDQPTLPALAGEAPLPSAALPAAEAPSIQAPDAPGLPSLPALPAAPTPLGNEALLPEEPLAPAEPAPGRGLFLPPIAMPPAEAVGATAAVGGALAVVGFALYSRLSRGQILDHERRDEVYQLVRGEPGISLTDIASRTGLGWGTVVYHLDRLEKAGFVTSEKSGARRCFFPVGEVPREERAHLGTLQHEALRSAASIVHERPGVTQGELAQALGITASAASKQVTKLENVGLVRREREWKTVRLHPEPKLAQLLAPA